MKRILVLALAATMIATLGSGVEAKKKKKPKRISREVSAPYDTPAPGLTGGPWAGNCGSPSTGCVSFPTSAEEGYAMITIEDASGQDSSGSVWRGTGTELELIAQFCGSTTEPLEIPAGEPITITAHMGPSPGNVCPGIATQGTIKATLSNLP